ncbi:hypothetical protein FGB62_34g13 [Gracilaria domingensis]|nr:hypothetical protein FGB62_34g13 [Gracilaria domingensis]
MVLQSAVFRNKEEPSSEVEHILVQVRKAYSAKAGAAIATVRASWHALSIQSRPATRRTWRSDAARTRARHAQTTCDHRGRVDDVLAPTRRDVMTADVQLIADGAQLASSLFTTTVTVLLLSSPFSSETESALTTVSHAAALTSCPSVQYAHFSMSPGDTVETPRRWFSYTNGAVPVVKNLTEFPPLFPFVRLFQAHPHPFVSEFRGSFDAFVLARFISDACGVDMDFPPALSRDDFARAVRSRAFGVLLIVPMRKGRLRDEHRRLAFAVADAVKNSYLWWELSLVDSEKDPLFAQRVAHESLLFVHLPSDKAVLHPLSRVSAHQIASLMRSFEQAPPRTLVREVSLKPSKQLSYFEHLSDAKAVLRHPQSRISLSAFLQADYSAPATRSSVLWVLVIQTWCAYCQRILPVYQQFARIAFTAHVDVDVLFVEQVDVLPPFLDRLVDGYLPCCDWSSLMAHASCTNMMVNMRLMH